MKDWRSLAHIRWECKYHIVMVPKYRQRVLYGSDNKARGSLSQYIARCPISLEKLKYKSFHGKVLFKTHKYNDYFKENFKVFDVLDFIVAVTAHIPPKYKEYIRRYGVKESL